ncbi:MAG: cytochrome c3 family protein [Phycisphaerae bacterium]|nr:cytochrome c3 family protein [Phycisphaerae bacterium]
MGQLRQGFRYGLARWGLASACVLLVAGGAVLGQVAGAPKPALPATPQPSCIAECHQPIVNHTVRHDPAAADCSACHVPVGDASLHKFALPVAKEDLCVRCHQLPAEKHSHVPVAEGKCLECHDPHGSEHRAQLVGDPNRDLCLKCHNEQFMKKAFVHGPVAVGACATCHTAHSSALPRLLISDANTLCATCHAETGKPADGMHVHKAMDQGCVSCHDAHSSDHNFQLRSVAPELCLSCHKEQFDRMTVGAPVVHGAVTEPGGCTTCHEPHSSKLAGLQRAGQPDSCLKCHDQPIKDDRGKPLTNMAKLLATNPNKHGPIRAGHCTVCHDPHAGKTFRLLPAEYPAQFYAPFSLDLYALCFRCHTSDLVTKTNGAGVTQFRDGARNLHALHVNQEKGRTCRACHEVHASQRPSHIRESVPFGTSNWLLEINYQATEEGGSCAPGCHAPKKYARPKAVLPAPKETMGAPPGAAASPTTGPGVSASPAPPVPGVKP